jgi:glycosyltransferase involved in cell wall biosynthesis
MSVSVSVIVPVYNVEKYLDECLSSLVNQTLSELEIIVVNDGTKDNSQSIIDHYVKQYPNKVVSLIKENGGLGDARNYGIPYAKGEYIGFVDSDDIVHLEMYEKMFNKAKLEDSDLVLCDLEYFYETSSEKMVKEGLVQIENIDVNKTVFLSPLFAWNKLYRRSLFIESGLKYPIGLWYEDIPVTVPFFTLAKKISYVHETLIYYRQRSTSIMGSVDNPKVKDIFDIMHLCLNYFKDHNLLETYHDELEFLFLEHLMLNGGFRFLLSHKYKDYLAFSIDTLDLNFPHWRNNKYLFTLPRRYQIYIKYMHSFMIIPFSIYLKLKEKRKPH